jgi:hypothetical protein
MQSASSKKKILVKSFPLQGNDFFFFFFDLRGCPGQLARTTTNLTAHWTPCKLSGHVRHRGGDRHAHENSNPGAAGGDKPLLPPGQDPQCYRAMILILKLHDNKTWSFWLFYNNSTRNLTHIYSWQNWLLKHDRCIKN